MIRSILYLIVVLMPVVCCGLVLYIRYRPAGQRIDLTSGSNTR